ncbi:MAG: RNA polymerase sporulation sigma factor SigK [Lachnospiraceae bacterium]|nr:RNA polymerase sporulation sigma factor SigK [Lachnospiraceae bacterium]
MQTFKQPLTKKEEEEFIRLFLGQDEEKREWAKQVLIERNLRLVAHIAKKYQGTDVETEDLISIGTVGLIKALFSFSPEKQSKLGTYAARCIENEILMYFRAKKKSSREVSLYEPIGTDKEGNEISLLDVIEVDQEDVVDKMQLQEETKRLLGLLPHILEPREEEIIRLRYGLNGRKELTQREIGEKLAISRSYISRIEKRALEKLRAALERE